MHRGLVVSCGIAACIMAAAHAGVAGTGTMDKETAAKLDAIVAQAVQDKVFPGAVLVVGRGPKVQYQKEFGRYTYETTSPAMAANTLFDLASVSKVAGPQQRRRCCLRTARSASTTWFRAVSPDSRREARARRR